MKKLLCLLLLTVMQLYGITSPAPKLSHARSISRAKTSESRQPTQQRAVAREGFSQNQRLNRIHPYMN